MGTSTETTHEHMKRDLRVFEGLLAEWKHSTDPESLWILALLREAAEQLRRELGALRKMTPTKENRPQTHPGNV